MTPRAARWVTIGAALALAALAAAFWFVADDAFISFRYARSWARGDGLRYQPGEGPPVEGYSNFLWVAIAALVERVGAAPHRVMPALSLLSGVALVFGVAGSARRLGLSRGAGAVAAVALALSPGAVVWCTGGLATMPHALLLWLVGDRWLLADDPEAEAQGAVAALALALLRTEGIAWVGVVLVLAVAVRALEGRPVRRLLGTSAVAGLLWSVYFGWRWQHFGTLLSNTAHAKGALSLDRVGRGAVYVIGTWLALLSPALHLLGIPPVWRAARWRGAAVTLLAIAPPAYAAVVGGDFMAMGRLLVPALPWSALLVAALADRLASRRGPLAAGLVTAIVVGAGLPVLVDADLVPRTVRESFRFRWNTRAFRSEAAQWRFMRENTAQWTVLGRALGQEFTPDDAVVAGAIGALGYFSDLRVLDRFGLVSPEVATRSGPSFGRTSPGHDRIVPIVWFLDREPEVLWADVAVTPRELQGDAREARELQRTRASASYGPVARVREVGGARVVLITVERMDDPSLAWAQWDARVAAVGAHLP